MRRLSRKCLRSGRLITHCHRARFLHPLLARTYYQTLPQLSVSTSLLVIRPFSSATVSDTPRHDSLDQDTGRREQKPPDTVQEVLDFWFGWEDWRERKTDTQKYRDAKFSFWFMGGREVDSQCKAFVPLIEAADKGKLQGHEWTSIDGLVAQIVLLDQLSRNCFRGTKRAYAYDTQAIKTAVILMDKIKDNPSDLPGAGLLFLSACLMHSEELALHAKLTGFIEASIVDAKTKGQEPSPYALMQLDPQGPGLASHTLVIQKFGRYPHRNELYGRESTAEEEAWLKSPSCPGWAKSQTKTQSK